MCLLVFIYWKLVLFFSQATVISSRGVAWVPQQAVLDVFSWIRWLDHPGGFFSDDALFISCKCHWEFDIAVVKMAHLYTFIDDLHVKKMSMYGFP